MTFSQFNPDDKYPILTCKFAGRLGNQCLEAFKTFLVAQLNNIPFKNVFFNIQYYKEFFSNFKEHFIELSKVDLSNFKIYSNYNCQSAIDASANILLTGYNWQYPSSIDSFKLFNQMFDNVDKRYIMLQKYKIMFSKPVIGLTVRRTDTLQLSRYKTLTKDDIEQLILQYDQLYLNTENFFITSDDIEFLKKIIDLNKHPNVYLDCYENDCQNTLRLLSLCDVILSNGSCYYMQQHVKNKHVYSESTFGQIAQLLHMSYKYV